LAPDKVIRPAASRALSRAATTVRKAASQEIRKTYAIPAARAKGSFRIKRAGFRDLEAAVIATGQRVALGVFGARALRGRRTRGKVSVLVLKKEGRKVVRGRSDLVGAPFIAEFQGGHIGIYQRQTARRLKIKELFSINVPSAMVASRVSPRLLALGRQRFQTEFARELRFRLNRPTRGA
jgi:hypothetical protein